MLFLKIASALQPRVWVCLPAREKRGKKEGKRLKIIHTVFL